MKIEKITSYFKYMKKYILTSCAWLLDAISLLFSLPGALLIFIGFIFSDFAKTLKNLY